MAQREPCCWKRHSSSHHSSISSLRARRLSFFISALDLRIGFRNKRSRLSSAKAQLVEQTLALPHAKLHSIARIQVMTEQLSIPKILRMAEVKRRATKILSDSIEQLLIHSRRASRTLCLFKTGKTALLKTLCPILNCASTVAKKLRNLPTTESLAQQQYPMETMIISRLFGPKNFLLHSALQNLGICNLDPAHNALLFLCNIPERPLMRNYI